MNFDIVFVNPPFNYIKEFEDIARDHSNQYIWLVAKQHHIRNSKKFKDIIYFKNLGREVFKEEIEICSYLIDKDKQDDDLVYVENFDGENHQTRNIYSTPSTDMDSWKYAQDVMSIGLNGYKATRGFLFQRYAKIVSDGGVKCIWTSGGKNDIVWDYIDESQKDKLYGLGYHKIFVTQTHGVAAKIGEIKYADPSFGLAKASLGVILENKEECMKAIEYLNSDPVKKLVKGIKLGIVITVGIWASIPHHSLKDQWFHIYEDYNEV